MGCMKCGRETEENQVFCQSCQEVMKQYPVKPGIAIQLPKRSDNPGVKRPAQPRRRQGPTAEDTIRKLRKRVRRLVILWLITLALAAAMVYPTVQFIRNLDIREIGQNYTTITDMDETLP